jgi:hypothetical protein
MLTPEIIANNKKSWSDSAPNTINDFVHRAFPNHLSVDYSTSASKSR